MSLPVTDGSRASASSTVSTRQSTPTPTPGLDAPTIRSLVSRHTDDIRILDIKISNSATTIEYDLKPWPFVPNESIANEVVFKVICAIRNGQQIPNTLKFIGQSHFKSDVGRKFTAPSVEIRHQREQGQSHRLPWQQCERHQLEKYLIEIQIVSDSDRRERRL